MLPFSICSLFAFMLFFFAFCLEKCKWTSPCCSHVFLFLTFLFFTIYFASVCFSVLKFCFLIFHVFSFFCICFKFKNHRISYGGEHQQSVGRGPSSKACEAFGNRFSSSGKCYYASLCDPSCHHGQTCHHGDQPCSM